MGWISGEYYAPYRGQSAGFTMVEDVTYYSGIFVQEAITVDRICIRTGASWSGTGTIRLGVYNNSDGKPTTVLFDAGTVSATAANQTPEITINETLQPGWYWTAANLQTAATTNVVRGSIEFYREGLVRVGADADIQNRDNYSETGITGAFATAGTVNLITSVPVVFFRKT
ncbi:MAG: hypothetical protein ACO30N_07605 [Schleiferiaceae bacterium]